LDELISAVIAVDDLQGPAGAARIVKEFADAKVCTDRVDAGNPGREEKHGSGYHLKPEANDPTREPIPRQCARWCGCDRS